MGIKVLQIHILLLSFFILGSCSPSDKEPNLNPKILKLLNSAKKELNRQDNEIIGTIIFRATVKRDGTFHSIHLYRSNEMETTGWDGQYALLGIDENGNQLFQNWFGTNLMMHVTSDKECKKVKAPFTFVTMKVPNYRTLRYMGIRHKSKIIMTFDLKTELKD